MAYTVNKTDGSVVTTIVDGTIDNTTSLTLFGKSYSGFGELLNEDLVKLLENSASTSSPIAPLTGELWFDTSTKQIKVYDGSSFKPTGGAKSQSSAPSSPSSGDLWTDSSNNQLYFYTGSAWQLVGPLYTSGQTLSGWKIETINNSLGVAKVISSMYNGNQRVAILSTETFTPASPPTGFAEIYAGITLNSTLGAKFAGTTDSASYVDISGTTNTSATLIAGGNFLRSDTADTTTGRITILSDEGLVLGASSDLELTVSGINSTIRNTSTNGNLNLGINYGGDPRTPIVLDGTNNRVGIFTSSPTVPLEITGDVKITGNLTISGEYNSSTSNVSTYDDVYIKVNNGNATDADSGLIVEKATGDARMYWNSTAGQWYAGTGTYSQVIRLADAVVDGDANKEKVLKTDSSGNVIVTTVTLANVGSNISTSSTSNKVVATVGQVAESITRWGGSVITADGSNTVAGKRYIETVAPTDAQGDDGDLWFVRES